MPIHATYTCVLERWERVTIMHIYHNIYLYMCFWEAGKGDIPQYMPIHATFTCALERWERVTFMHIYHNIYLYMCFGQVGKGDIP